MRARLTVLAFRLAWRVVPLLPEGPLARCADLAADIAWLRNGKGVQRLQQNLARVTGVPATSEEARALARRGMRSYARYWRETFAIDGWTMGEISERVHVIGIERVQEAIAAGTGVVLAATHSGNWDLGGVYVSHLVGGGTTVAERLEPVALFDAFVRAREKYGMEIVPHAGGPRPAFAVLLERVRANRIVALVADRDLSRRGVDVRFFGAPARMAAGPAALALATGAPLMPVAIWNDGPRIVFEVRPPLATRGDDDVASLTQRLADEYASIIAAHPEDWHMLQRVWVDGERAA